MKKNLLLNFCFATCFIACFTLFTHNLLAQSNPAIDRPIQQCISKNKDKLENLKPNFSIGHWLTKLAETCDKLESTKGKGGGPQVMALLTMEKELDDLLSIADECPQLTKIKQGLVDIKTTYTENKKSDNFTISQEGKDGDFDTDKELATYSLPRSAASKIRKKAEKARNLLKK